MGIPLETAIGQLQIQDKESMAFKRIDIRGRFAQSAQLPFLQKVKEIHGQGKPVRIIICKARQLGMCLAPWNRVLTADLRWVPIDEVQPGDSVVAVDEEVPGGRGNGRKMRTAQVVAKQDVYAQAFRLTMDNGEVLTATAEHRFLGKVRGAVHTCWRSVQDTRVGDEIRFVTRPWDEGTFEDGWFGGILDGEGSLRPKSRAGVEVCAAQIGGDVFDRMTDYLKRRGYQFRVDVDERAPGTSKMGKKPVYKVVLSRMSELFRLVGQTRPSRFLARQWWEGKDLPGRREAPSWAKVVSIEPLAEMRMVDLQTTRGTFVAEGFVSHNSTVTEALLFVWAMIYHPGTNGLVLAHERPTATELFAKTKRYWDTWPLRKASGYKLLSNTRQWLVWDNPPSQIHIASAQNLGSGVGQTLHFLHGSEVALWPEPEELMTGLAQTVPQRHGTAIILESTARGVGNYFHDQWLRASAGKSDYVPLFFPWFNHFEYTAEHIGISSEVEELDDEEKDLIERYGIGLSQIAWRRFTIENGLFGDVDKFRQEYPACAEEAFLTSGRPVFPYEKLEKCYKPQPGAVGNLHVDGNDVVFRNHPLGSLTLFRKPHPQCDYIVAGDPTHAMHDRGCIQVINRASLEQVAVWHGICHPAAFGDELIRVAQYYNGAIINTEVTGPGNATIGTLMARNYPNIWLWRWADRLPTVMSKNVYGFQTNWKSKEWAIGWLLEEIHRESVRIHDQVTYNQMRDYAVISNNGDYGPGTRRCDEETGIGYDDAVMALALANLTNRTEGPPLHEPTVEERFGGLLTARNMGNLGQLKSVDEVVEEYGT